MEQSNKRHPNLNLLYISLCLPGTSLRVDGVRYVGYINVHKRAKSESKREAAVTIGSHNVSVMRSIIYICGADYIAVTE